MKRKTTADAEASIHSHPTKTEVVGEKVYSGNAQEPSATDTTTFANTVQMLLLAH
ncbi:hypothetical protein [Chryseobacterium lathyri]|uniref:Uncharacterized protein n=1 Tax=Chryseobacterium lathyri TaxID=395933 RepID=A0ABT9SRC1_9FLAO|nr:hypothetical protein [Chryseobacterium lathyri]MDP9961972.1 hypothetical protein [Chryseobacterium lathyri]